MLKLFRYRIKPGPAKPPRADSTMESRYPGAGLYVDTENLQRSAQPLVETIIGQWPGGTPPLSRLNLYVRADRVSLWDAWADSRFPRPTVTASVMEG